MDGYAAPPGDVNMAEIMRYLRENLPPVIVTNGAGNYATWLHRYCRFRHHQSQLAPTSGSMGYGIPAVAAKADFQTDLFWPSRVMVFSNDHAGLATARQIGAISWLL